MNHLAHLFLAGPSDHSLVGNIAGDFVKGPLRGRFHPAIERGIAEHRKIDAFTDSHPEAGAFRRIVAADHGHYARVISDVFLDHFLAFDFERYAAEPLAAFLQRTFARLDAHVESMPAGLRAIYPRLRNDRWIESYKTIDGIWTALFYMSRRFSRGPRLEMATHLLIDARPALLDRFNRFMPDVIDFANGLRSAS